jgi:hypothetical protein
VHSCEGSRKYVHSCKATALYEEYTFDRTADAGGCTHGANVHHAVLQVKHRLHEMSETACGHASSEYILPGKGAGSAGPIQHQAGGPHGDCSRGFPNVIEVFELWLIHHRIPPNAAKRPC